MKNNKLYRWLFLVAFLLVSFNSFSQQCHRVFVNMTADYAFYEQYGFDEAYIESEMETSFNFAAQTFQQYGIYLVKGDFTIIKNENNDPYIDIPMFIDTRFSGDIFDVMNEEHPTLGGNDNFGINPYTNELGYTYDVDILFTGSSFFNRGLNEGQLGAVTNGIGNLYSDEAYILVYYITESTRATLSERVTHELGHVFNARHCASIYQSLFHNCENEETIPAPIEQSLMNGAYIDSEGIIPIIAPNNLTIINDFLSNHKDFVYTIDVWPFSNPVIINSSHIYQASATLTVNSPIATTSNSTTLLLKSSEIVKSTSGARFVPQGSSKIKMIIDPSLNDYCSPSTNTSSLRSASIKLERKSQIENELSTNSVLDKSISLYPNPATNYINIDFSLTDKSIVKVSVFDYVGRYLFDLDNNELNSGSHQKQYDISNLSMGMYIVKVNTVNESKSFQIIKN